MENLVFRKVIVGDIEQLKVLYGELIKDRNYETCKLKDYFSKEQNLLDTYAVCLEEKIIATAQLVIYENLVRAPLKKAIIDSVVVKNGFQQQGVGSFLISNLIKIAKSESVELIMLISSYKRYKAYDFYRKHGFKDEGLGFILDLTKS